MRFHVGIRFIVCVVIAFTAVVRADQITLKNGDRITGEISSSDGKTLVIKTDYAGELNVKWDQVSTVSSDKPLYVLSDDGQLLRGRVTTSDHGFEVDAHDVGHLTVPRDHVKALRSEEQERAIGDWSGFADAGLSLSRGNSETTNFVLGASATRATEADKWNVYASSLWANSQIGNVTQTTASAIHGGLRYDFDLSKRTSLFAFTDFDHDRFQELDLRNVIGGGLNYHWLKTERTQFDLFGGADFNQEFFTNITRRTAEALVGQQLDQKLTGNFAVHERLGFSPNLSDLGEYRMVLDLGTTTKISKAFSLQLTLSDRYLSNPVLGLKGNDLLLSTGLRFSFGPGAGR